MNSNGVAMLCLSRAVYEASCCAVENEVRWTPELHLMARISSFLVKAVKRLPMPSVAGEAAAREWTYVGDHSGVQPQSQRLAGTHVSFARSCFVTNCFMKFGMEQDWIEKLPFQAVSCVIELRPARVCLWNTLPSAAPEGFSPRPAISTTHKLPDYFDAVALRLLEAVIAVHTRHTRHIRLCIGVDTCRPSSNTVFPPAHSAILPFPLAGLPRCKELRTQH